MARQGEQDSAIEVAVEPGYVVINYQSQVGPGAWGHFSFTPEEAYELITALQQARHEAIRQRNL